MTHAKATVEELLSKSEGEIATHLGDIYEHSFWVAEKFVKNKDVCSSEESTVSALAAAMKTIVDEASQAEKMILLKGYF